MDIPHNCDTFVIINDPTLTHLYHLKFIVCIRVHSFFMGFRQTFHTFYGFRQKYTDMWSFTGGSVVKNPPANAEDADLGSVLGQEDPLEEEIAAHSSIHAWKIPWTEESGKLQSIGSQRVGHNATEHTRTHTDLYQPL